MTHDEQLINASRQGDVTAFNQLVALYEKRIYGLCYRVLNDREAAADATQDTWFAVYRSLSSFRGGSFCAWLLRIAANNCYSMLRARKRRPTISLDMTYEDDDARFEPTDPAETPDELVLRHELSTIIQQSLTQIPEEQRNVVIMSDLQGMAYAEIADSTGVNMGTVKSRLNRGRARLRVLLQSREVLPGRYQCAC